jgi:hypothetical protein
MPSPVVPASPSMNTVGFVAPAPDIVRLALSKHALPPESGTAAGDQVRAVRQPVNDHVAA